MNRVLITGGTGTLGRMIAQELPKPVEVVLFSRNAHKQELMRQDYPDFRYVLGDIRDRSAVENAMAGCDHVYHTAALKYVPLCEANPREAHTINVRGALNVIEAALWMKVDKVMNISTDKVVSPVSVYGRTKARAERLFQANGFASCRFGNFIGSDGSVVPLFRTQAESGEITITDRNMVRYWITIRSAAEYAIERLSESTGGEIYIPKMSLIKLKEIVELVAPGVKQKEIGLRLGEKLEEEIISNEEWEIVEEREHDYVIHKSA